MDKSATFSFTIYDLDLCHTVLGFWSVLLFRKGFSVLRVSVIAGLDYWTGLLDWTTGLDYWTDIILCTANDNDVIIWLWAGFDHS